MISFLNVTLPENPTPFTSPISFEITFQSDANLDEGLFVCLLFHVIFLFHLSNLSLCGM